MKTMMGAGRRLDLFDQAFEAVFKLALDAGAGLQQGQVERADGYVFQRRRRNIAVGYADGESFDDGGLTDARFASQYRIVLAAAHEDVDHLPDFGVASEIPDRSCPPWRVPVRFDGELIDIGLSC